MEKSVYGFRNDHGQLDSVANEPKESQQVKLHRRAADHPIVAGEPMIAEAKGGNQNHRPPTAPVVTGQPPKSRYGNVIPNIAESQRTN
jgi:hypothetical protein